MENWTGSYENIMGLPLEPLRAWGLGYIERVFPVRSYEAGVNNRMSLPSLCNYLQEIAGIHADKLGVGIHLLQSEGITWMLSRLRLEIGRGVPWGEELKIRTWPSGTRGRLTATRDFIGECRRGRGFPRRERMDDGQSRRAQTGETAGKFLLARAGRNAKT